MFVSYICLCDTVVNSVHNCNMSFIHSMFNQGKKLEKVEIEVQIISEIFQYVNIIYKWKGNHAKKKLKSQQKVLKETKLQASMEYIGQGTWVLKINLISN